MNSIVDLDCCSHMNLPDQRPFSRALVSPCPADDHTASKARLREAARGCPAKHMSRGHASFCTSSALNLQHQLFPHRHSPTFRNPGF